ncbi:MAG: lipocalin family protein [Alistipes sp.]|nr:lipocalin family protein [Alistipes sp.]MDE6858498.1 lipocalin family protein [Alistipes sp.]
MKRFFSVVMAALVVTACDDTPKQFVGIVDDASMNTVTAVDYVTGDKVTFSTEGADFSESVGILVGAPVVVDYRGEAVDGARALKVVTDATYINAVGRWIASDPIDDAACVGVELFTEGRAESINMATLRYTGWELQGEPGVIMLKGQSIGNGQTIDFTADALIYDENGLLLMALDGTDTVYRKAMENQ